MRVFVTGASGFIGSAVVPELLANGHEVLGLARSDASAAALEAAGADVHRGSLDEPASLAAGAAASDGVIHLAYNHDFSDMAGAAATDRAAIDAIGTALEGSDRPFVIASGTLGITEPGVVATERDYPDPEQAPHPRVRAALATLAFADRGVRASVLRLSPSVHGEGDGGFVAALIAAARQRGVSGYVGDGENRWTGVHRLDAARLFRRAVEAAPAGSTLHGVETDGGVPTRHIAEAIGAGLGLPVASIDPAEAPEHFGWIARFFAMDGPASSAITRELLDWGPTHPDLLADLAAGHYFEAVTA